MLDEKYGRLIVIGAFSAVLIGLLSIPGLHTPKQKKNDQLNTNVTITRDDEPIVTQQQKEEFNQRLEQGISDLSRQIEQQTVTQPVREETTISREEQMLNDWGMNSGTAPQNVQQNETSTETELSHHPEPVVQDVRPPQPSQPEKPKRIPNSKTLKVNGKCYSSIAVPKTMSKADCDSTARVYGVKSCPARLGRDAWAGAATACGGVSKMPDLPDLFAIARLVYDREYITLSGKHYTTYASLGKFSEQDGPCEKFSFDRITYKPDIAAEYGLPETTGYTLWSGHEISPSYAFALTFNDRTVDYNSCRSKADTTIYALCEIPCK